MSRVKGKKPPKPMMNSAQPRNMSFDEIQEIPIGSRVIVRLNDGKVVIGKLNSYSDYLVGCPTVYVDGAGLIGIWYQGEIISAIAGE